MLQTKHTNKFRREEDDLISFQRFRFFRFTLATQRWFKCNFWL